jgi:hypothetical protein
MRNAIKFWEMRHLIRFTALIILVFSFVSRNTAFSQGSDNLFPVELTFELNSEKKEISVHVVNRSKQEIVVDLSAVKSAQLVYWSLIGKEVISSGYTTPIPSLLSAANFDIIKSSDKDRFVIVPPSNRIDHTIPLTGLLLAVQPFVTKFPDDGFVGVQVYGTGLSVARVQDGISVFDDQLVRAISIGKPLGINKHQLEELLK